MNCSIVLSRFLSFALAATLVSSAVDASAQSSASDEVLAQSLFDQGRKLMKQERYSEACEKLEESQRLDPSGGTVLNLALCLEQEGKIASAWTRYKTALSYARRDGRTDRAREAQKRIAALEAKLPKLTVRVLRPAEGQEVRVDGTPIGRAAWGMAVAVDPGTHVVTSTAPTRESWKGTVVAVPGESGTIEVPPLPPADDEASPAGTSSAEPEPEPEPEARGAEEPGGSSNTVAWIVGSTGVVALGVGSFFGVRALSKRSESDDECPTDDTCSERGVALNEDAKTAAWVANIGIGAGIVGIGVSAYLLLTSDGSPSPADVAKTPVTVDAFVGPGGGGISLSGEL